MALTKCLDCGRDVSDQAPACPGCGRPIAAAQASAASAPSAAPQVPSKKTSGCAVGCATILVFLAILWFIGYLTAPTPSGSRPTSGGVPQPAPTPIPPVLELESWSWSHEYGHAIAEGRVKNISGDSLRNVAAQVSYFTKGGQFIASDDALVEFNPILPGQTSPFKVIVTWNPEMNKAQVEFKTLFGGPLPWHQKEKKLKP
jgi:hypothetical protein